MDITALHLFQSISWAGVAGLFIYYILRPLILMLMNKTNPQNDRLNKLEKIVTNEYSHRFQEIEKRLDNLELLIGDLREKVGRIEGKIK